MSGSGKLQFTELISPLDFDKRKTTELPHQPGVSLATYAQALRLPGDARMVFNGKLLTPEEWAITFPKPGDAMLAHCYPAQGQGAKGIIRMVALIAVAVLAAAFGGPLGVALGMQAGALATAVGAGIITAAGALLISFILPPPTLAAKTTTPTYSWSGPQMTSGQGTPISKNIGKFPPAPKVIESYVQTIGDQQYMNILLSYGHGIARQIGNIRVNDNPIENYKGVYVEKRMGYNVQDPIPFFTQVVNEFPQSTQLTVAGGGFVINGKRTDTEAIEVDYEFPKGIFFQHHDGSHGTYNVWVRLEYSLHGSGVWKAALAPRTTAAISGANHWVAISQDQYSGGPASVVVVATAPDDGSVDEGDPFDEDLPIDVFNGDGTFAGTQTRNYKGFWTRNPNTPGSPTKFGASVASVGTWSNVTGKASGNDPNQIKRLTLRVDNLPPGQYDVRVSKIGSSASDVIGFADANNPTLGDDVFVTSVREIAYDDLSYPGIIQLGLRLLATDQLSGGGVNVTADVEMDDPETIGYKHLVAADRPQIYYRLGEEAGLAVVDFSGRGNNGAWSALPSAMGVPGLVKGSPNKAVQNLVAVWIIPGTPIAPGDSFSVDAWVRPDQADFTIQFITVDNDNNISLGLDGKLNYRVGGVDHKSATVLVLGTAYHVAVVLSGGVVKFVINGVIDALSYVVAPIGVVFVCFVRNSTLDEFVLCSPAALLPRFMQRYIWGISRHNILEDFTGDNHAMATWDVMTDQFTGGGIPFGMLDELRFKEWAERNNEIVSDGVGGEMYRHTAGAVFDTVMNIWDAVLKLAVAARAALIRTGTKYTTIIDKPDDPVQVFNVANIIKGSFKQNWVMIDDRANSIDIQFNDAANDFKRTLMTVNDDDSITAGDDVAKAPTVDLFSVTSEAEAWREGSFRLKNNKNLKQNIEFDVDIDSLACRVGNVILVQHDLPRWAQGGRLLPESQSDNVVDQSHIALDAKVSLDPAKDYEVLVVLPTVKRASGEIDTGIAAVAGDIITLPGYAGEPVKRMTAANGGIDVKVLDYGAGWVQVDDTYPWQVGMDWAVWDTDVLETCPVTNPGDATPTQYLTLAAPLSAKPDDYALYCFGETAIGLKKFRVAKISRMTDLSAKISAGTYSPDNYTDDEPVLAAQRTGYPAVGPNRPTVAGNNGAAGTRAWGGAANVFASDNTYASASTSGPSLDQQSNQLRIFGFKLRCLPGDVINGIRVKIERHASAFAGGFVEDVSVQLLKASAPYGTAKTIAGHWPTVDSVMTYGDEDDLWGGAFIPSEVNDDGFGVLLQARLVSGAGGITTALVDSVTIEVDVSRAVGATVMNLVVREQLTPTSAGPFSTGVTATWTPGPQTAGAKVYAAIKPSGAAAFKPETLVAMADGVNSAQFNANTGDTVIVRVIGYDAKAQDAPYLGSPSRQIVVSGVNALPAVVVGFDASDWSSSTVHLAWAANTEPDLYGYEIRYSPDDESFDWYAGTPIATPGAGATSFAAGNGPGCYMIKAMNSQGNQSQSAAFVAIGRGTDGLVGNGKVNVSNNMTVISAYAGGGVDTITGFGPGGVGTSGTHFRGSGGNVTLPAFTMTGKAPSTVYWIVRDTRNNVYIAFTTFGDALPDYYIPVAAVTTVDAAGAGGTTGGGGGSPGGEGGGGRGGLYDTY